MDMTERHRAELENAIYRKQDHLLAAYERLRGQLDTRRAKVTNRVRRIERSGVQLAIGAVIGLGMSLLVSMVGRVVRSRRAPEIDVPRPSPRYGVTGRVPADPIGTARAVPHGSDYIADIR